MNKCIFLLCVMVAASNTTFADSQDKIAKLAHECQAGKAKACNELAKIATRDKDRKVRQAAVEKLSDQVLLKRIAMTDEAANVWLAAVTNLTDQGALAELAQQSSEKGLAAVARLTDQVLLADIARAAPYWNVREAAVAKLTDQVALADIARKGSNRDMRRSAIIKLTDQTVLAELAKTTDDWETGLAAVARLTDQDVLSDIARTAPDGKVREAAVAKLTDEITLVALAKTTDDPETGIIALKRITDQAVLADIARTATAGEIRQASVLKVTDQATLVEIARNDSQRNVRHSAMEKISDQIRILEIAKADPSIAMRSSAVKKLANKAMLAEIARKDKAWYVRSVAAWGLTDQATLAKIAGTDVDSNVRSAAVWKLTDNAVLSEIAKKDKDPYVRETAAMRSDTDRLPELDKIVSEIEAIEKLEFQTESIQFALKPDNLTRLLAIAVTPHMDGFIDCNRLVLVNENGTKFKYTAVAPIARQGSAWLANGGPLPLDKHDVTVNFTGDKLIPDFKPCTETAKFIWSGAGAKFRVLFEVDKASRIFSLRFNPFPPISVISDDQAPQEYAIDDHNFVDSSLPDTQLTNVRIIDARDDGLMFSGHAEMKMDKPLVFANGARHTWMGTINAFGYVFSSDAKQPLVFRVDNNRGYTYLKGFGTIKFPDGRTVVFGEQK